MITITPHLLLSLIKKASKIARLHSPRTGLGQCEETQRIHKGSWSFESCSNDDSKPPLPNPVGTKRDASGWVVMDRMVVRIPFQYIAAFIVPSRRSCPGCWRLWWYHIVAHHCNGVGITSLPLLQMHFWSSIIRSSSPLSRIAFKELFEFIVSFLGFYNLFNC